MVDQDDRILRINAVLDCTGLTRATLYRKIADGSFPPRSGSIPGASAGASQASGDGSPPLWLSGRERQ